MVVKNKTPVFKLHLAERSQSDFIRLAELAESMIAAEHFAPNEQCFYCNGSPHQEACRNWHVERSRVTVMVNMAA